MNRPNRPWTAAALSALDCAEFTRILGPIFEHSPWVAEATWPRRPFASLDTLHRAMCESVEHAGGDRQIALVQAHPDLVGRAAESGTLTSASTREQSSAGLDRLTAEEIARFQQFNRAYHSRFGFPFVICARLNRKESILAAFPARLANSREAELQAALAEIGKIARLRLEDLIQP